jgi:PadR family transcriptional regulator PadR
MLTEGNGSNNGDQAREDGAEKWEAQLRKGCLELAVMAVLRPERSYGLEILRALEEHSNLVLSEGTIYPILNRLRQDGFVSAQWVESDSGHPRKYYSLTAKGRERAIAMAETWLKFAEGMTALVEPLTRPSKKRSPGQ